jgi:hypothetical protein
VVTRVRAPRQLAVVLVHWLWSHGPLLFHHCKGDEEFLARYEQASVALSLCTTASPLHTRFTRRFGASTSITGAKMRPNPRYEPGTKKPAKNREAKTGIRPNERLVLPEEEPVCRGARAPRLAECDDLCDRVCRTVSAIATFHSSGPGHLLERVTALTASSPCRNKRCATLAMCRTRLAWQILTLVALRRQVDALVELPDARTRRESELGLPPI